MSRRRRDYMICRELENNHDASAPHRISPPRRPDVAAHGRGAGFYHGVGGRGDAAHGIRAVHR